MTEKQSTRSQNQPRVIHGTSNLKTARQRLSVARIAVNEILKMLRSGKYSVGDKLPTELELIKILGVGRSTVREAVKELVVMKLVEIRRGRGTYLLSLPQELLMDPTSFGEVANDFLLEELLEVREIFEGDAAALAAERATDADIHRLREDVERLQEAVATGYQPEEDLGFHFDVVQSAHNSALIRVSDVILSFYARTKSLPSERDVLEHQAIFERIAARDAEGARKAMYIHLARERESLKKNKN